MLGLTRIRFSARTIGFSFGHRYKLGQACSTLPTRTTSIRSLRTNTTMATFQSALSGLATPVKELVLKATDDGANSALLGEGEADQTSVSGWIEKTAKGELVNGEGSLKNLNDLLVPKTYLATNYLTAADVALYGTLHPLIASSSNPFSLPSLTRYFDHIQSRPVVRASAEALQQFPVITFDLENAPKIERKAEPPKKKKEKEPAAAAAAPAVKAGEGKAEGKGAAAAAAAGASNAAPAANEKGQPKKEKKEKQKKDVEEGSSTGKKAPKQKAPAADEGEPVPSMIDLRVGHIVDVIKHPDADGLYVEQIDLGEETGPRTVVSGLVNYIPIENMRDKYLVAVCNLKPANMRGVKSFAMVLCATSKEGKDGGIELIQPPEGSKPGDRVYFEGEAFENATPLPQLNPKKKIFETIQPGFITLDSKEAAWINPATKSVHKIRTKDGVCVAPTLVGASLS